MKKIGLLVLLASVSLNSYAEGVTFDAASCNAPFPGENHGGCFQNNTGIDIGHKDFLLVEKTTFTLGPATTATFTLNSFSQNNFVNISWSAESFLKVKQRSYSLTYKGKSLPGCTMEISGLSRKLPTVVIVKSGDELHC